MPDTEPLRLPGPTDRLAIVGRTGSGKTVAALWHLSLADFHERPWIILDYKRERLFQQIERAEPIAAFEPIPDEPGIYILRVDPDKKEAMTEWFHKAWEHEKIGILIDEGYMIDQRDEWFDACLTQGRSKNIQMIVLSQRPVWLSRFVFSEATFFQVFDLSHSKDMDKVREYVRDDETMQLDEALDPHHSFYYDVAERKLDTLGPVPHQEDILLLIDARLSELEYEEEHQGEPRSIRRPL